MAELTYFVEHDKLRQEVIVLLIRKYEVGERYPDLAGPEEIKVTVNAAGIDVRVRFLSPTEKEIQNMKKGPLQVRYCVLDSIIFFLFKWGELQWMDAPFSAALESHIPIPKIPHDAGLALNTFLSMAELEKLKF